MSMAQIRANLKRIEAGLPKLASGAASAGADVILERIQGNLIPGHGYDTGALHDSEVAVQVAADGRRVVYAIGPDPNAPAKVAGRAQPYTYAEPVEFGTSKAPAIPAMRLGFDEGKTDAASAIADHLRAGLGKIVK